MEPTGKSSASGLRKSTRKSGKPNEKSIASPAAVKTAVSSAIPTNPNSLDDLPSAALDKPNGKSIASSADVENPKEKTADSAPSLMNPAAAAAHPVNRDQVMLFRVVKGSAWYYISCGGCKSKAPTSLLCSNRRCGKTEVTGVAQYLTKISVYDKSEQATFVLLGDAGKELTGKHAAELVGNYFEHCVPVPRALLDTIGGQTRKFIVKVSDHNLTGKTQTITVTKVLPPDAALPATSADVSRADCGGSGTSKGSVGSAGDRARKAADVLESDEVKRTKSG